MHILTKETIFKIKKSLCSPYYKEWASYFEGVLRVSRKNGCRVNRKELLGIQLGLARVETMLWKKLKSDRLSAGKLQKLKLERELTIEEVRTLQDYEQGIFINEQLVRISRTICDGMAWRNLKYNRIFLSSAARGGSAGDIDVDGKSFKGEFDWACRISECFDSVVLLNDLTRFLRIGDLTEIGGRGVFAHEIKGSGREIKNLFTLQKMKKHDSLSDQSKRLLELQLVAFSDSVEINGVKVGTVGLNTPLRTNFKKLKNLLDRSERELVVSEKIESCITVHVTNFDAIAYAKKDVDIDSLKEKLNLPKEGGLVVSHSNWDTFYSDERGNFLRSMLPYSVFPLSAKQCMNLISGHYLVDCILDVESLKKILELHNWTVKIVTEKEVDQQIEIYRSIEKTIFSKKDTLYALSPEEIGILKIERGPFCVNLTPSLYMRLVAEFMTLETFLSMLEDMYRIASKKQKEEHYFPIFSNEASIWN